MREVKKVNTQKILQAYSKGMWDRIRHQPSKPPKDGPERTAYINGYHNK